MRLLDRLFGTKTAAAPPRGEVEPIRRDFPTYSRLLATPTRPLPEVLTARERSAEHAASIDARLRALTASPRPSDDDSVLTGLLSGQSGVVTFEHPSSGERIALYFTSPFRAADYLETIAGEVPKGQYLALTIPGTLRMLRDIEKMGITRYCLDRCPRCRVMVVLGASETRTREDVWMRLCITVANHIERTRLYLGYALAAAREGRLEEAREVALETAGHAAIDNADVHLLIGQVGLATSDGALVSEARAFLSVLGAQRHAEKLAGIAERGVADFAGP